MSLITTSFPVSSEDSTYIKFLRQCAKSKKDNDIEITTFEDFILAALVVIENANTQVSFILNDMSFRDIVKRGTLNSVTKDFIARGGNISIEVLRQATEEIRKKCRLEMLDGSSNSIITINRNFSGIQGDIVIGDEAMSAYDNMSNLGNANFGSPQRVNDLLSYKSY